MPYRHTFCLTLFVIGMINFVFYFFIKFISIKRCVFDNML